MSAGAPWSVKGIDPKARETAKDLARRAGMTLGEFLNQLIRDSDDEPQERARGREDRRPDLKSDLRSEIRGDLQLETRQVRPVRYDDGYMAPSADMDRLSKTLEILSDRLETAERRATMAINGVNNSVAGVLARLELAERGHEDYAQRFDRLSEEMRVGSQRLSRVETEQGQDRHAGQLKALEAAVGELSLQLQEGDIRAKAAFSDVREQLDQSEEKLAKVEAIARQAQAGASAQSAAVSDPQLLVELAVSRLAPRLEAAEARSREALGTLSASLEALETKMATQEGQANDRLDDLQAVQALGLKQLAEDLSERLEAAKADLGGHFESALKAQAGLITRLEQDQARGVQGRDRDAARLSNLERALFELNTAIGEAEKRSAGAVERMGREVLRIAENLHGRMAGIETRGAEVETRLAGDMRRLAEVVEGRFQAQDASHGQALERLGGEIARLSEKLTQRIADSERRTTFAIDEVSERFIRTTSQLEGRQERLAAETQERVQAIEAEVQNRMGHVKAVLESRLDQVRQEARAEMHERLAKIDAPMALEPFPDLTQTAQPVLATEPLVLDQPILTPQPVPMIEPDLQDQIARTPMDHPARTLAETARAAHEALYLTTQSAPAPVVLDSPQVAAPMVAQVADMPMLDRSTAALDTHVPLDDDFDMPRLSTRDAVDQAREQTQSRLLANQDRGLFRGLRSAPPRSRPGPATRPARDKGAGVRKTWVASTVAATAVLVGGGILSLLGEDAFSTKGAAKLSDLFAWDDGGQKSLESPAEAAKPAAPEKTKPATPILASLLTEKDGAATNALEIHKVHPSPEAVAAYEAAMEKLTAGHESGIKKLISAANLGHPEAQLTLGQAYEEGHYGLKKSPVDALRWYSRAAKGGSLGAMQALGVSYFYGKMDTPRDVILAMTWLQAAATRGYVDAQVNLAMIYQGRIQNSGIAADPKRALAWYMIAAQNGDADAAKSVDQVKTKLSPSDLNQVEQTVAAFKVTPDAPNAG